MKIKYAGLRPIISQHGISYKEGKEDKYVYLLTALEILQDIDNDFEVKKSYIKYISKNNLEEKQFHSILQKYDIHLEDEANEEIQNYKEKIKLEIKKVNEMKTITQIEKDVWCNNINLMSSYRIQRAINKIYYFHCINDIKTIIRHKRIKEIDLPFSEKYWHVAQSIKGALESGINSVEVKLSEITKDNDMTLKLEVLY